MPTVDSLDIQISAQATKASASIEELGRKLSTLSTSLSRINGSGLTGLANGVNRLSTAMQNMKSVGTADFTRLAKNIQKLGQIDTASINRAASAMSQMTRAFNQLGGVSTNAQQVGVLASNLSKLGYKSINSAITNLPALTSGLNNLMTTLSRAPQVSNNVIQMTNALANLASQGGRVGTASRTIVNGLNNSTNAMNRAAKSSTSLAAAFGKFYATWFLAIRGIKKLWGSIESSMDYVEVLNYFDAAFDQVAQKADLSSFQQLGYDSAEEYAKSFSERAKELTAQMTGFAVTDKGTLEATGMPSLGLNPSQLMQYQAMFGQMASSMGVASETSLKLSRALTEIGADLASVKNMDFDKVWTDMASGLAGMSRTLDKYGVNIRNVNLQQKLTELGINANIQALNQNDKALLRTIILLDSTRYAWGDLADTISQPANALRLTEASFQNLGRTIGNLFLPLVQKVLPYINALAIALQRLFTWLGNFIGIKWPDWEKATPDNSSMSDLLDSTEDVADGFNNATKAAEKLKKGIRGFDELEVINTKDESGASTGAGVGLPSGLLDAAFEDMLSEYQTVWDEAFANMENRAQEMADKVEKAFEPIKKIIQDFAIGDFFKAGQDTSNLIAGIFNFFANAIDNVDWYGIGQKIGNFFAGINWTEILSSVGNLIWQAIKASLEQWEGMFNAAPIETAIITAIGLLKFTGLGKTLVGNISKAISPYIKKIAIKVGITVAITEVSFSIGKSLSKMLLDWHNKEYGTNYDTSKIDEMSNWEIVVAGFKLTFNENGKFQVLGLENLKNLFPESKVANIIYGGLNGALLKAYQTLTFDEFWDTFSKGITGKLFEKITQAFSELDVWFSENVTSPISESFHKLWENVSGSSLNSQEDIKEVWGVVSGWFSDNITTPVSSAFETACDNISGFFGSLWNGIKKGVAAAVNAMVNAIEDALNFVVNGINGVIGGFNEITDWASGVMGVSWDGVDLVAKVSLGRINVEGYELGGFPKEYSLFMAGEHGRAEMLGTVGGQTAVAGGAEITGIRDAVYSTSQQEVELLREQNRLLQAILNKEFGVTRDEIGKNAQSWARDYSRRTGREAYSF